MKKGFTLVELLAVLAILSIVIVIAATSYSKVSNKNKKNQCIALKNQLENVAIEYVNDKNYFHDVNSLDKCCDNATIYDACGGEASKNEVGKYINEDKLYIERIMEKRSTGRNFVTTEIQPYTPTAEIKLENLLNFSYFELNENNKLENPRNGNEITNLKIIVKMLKGNNYTAEVNLNCGD